MNIRRKSFLALGAVGASALVAACGSSGSSTDTSTTASDAGGDDENAPSRADADLVIWGDDSGAGAVKEVAEAFAKDNGITVAVQALAGDVQSTFITAASEGSGPDIVIKGDANVAPFVQNGVISPVSLSEDQLASFVDSAVEGITYQGKSWGVPYSVESVFLVRNTDLVPEAPSTFEDLVAKGRAAVDAGSAERILNLPVSETGDFYHGEALFTSAGGYLFGTDAAGDADTSDVGVDRDGALAWAEKMAEYGEAGQKVLSRSVSGENAISLFTEGKTAFLMTGPWALEDLRSAGIAYDISSVPGFEGMQEARPFTATQAMFLASQGKNAALAEEFLTSVVASVDGQVTIAAASHRPPAMSEAVPAAAEQDADIPKIVAAAERGVGRPKLPEIKAVWQALDTAEAGIIGGSDPTEAMTAAATSIRSKVQ